MNPDNSLPVEDRALTHGRRGYAIAIAAAVGAVILRFALADLVGERTNFLFYFVAIIVAAQVSGRRAGLACLSICILANVLLFWPSNAGPDVTTGEILRTALFGLIGVAICASYGAMHRAVADLKALVRRRGDTEALLSAEIAQRAETEKSLRMQRDWLETTLINIGDATILVDEQERVVLMNPAAERLTGWKRDSVKGQHINAVFPLLEEKTRLPIDNPASKVIKTRAEEKTDEALLVNKNSVEHPVETSAAPMFDAEGHVAGVVIVFRDVATRRKSEREVQRLVNELREADRLKDEFLALLAHELRNPLAPIRSAIDIVRLGDDDSVRKACDILQRQSENMSRLVDDLLQVSRITHNQLEMRKVQTDLAPILRHALEMSRPLIEAKSHRLVEEIPSAPMPINADPTRLAQLFANLLNNAAKFTDPGGEVALTVERNPDRVVIAVSDTGMGIPRGMEDKIFQLFTQLDAGISRSQGGLGIGLTLVQRIAHMHGGSVRVARTEDPGTTFLVELPLSTTATAEREVNTNDKAETAGPLSLRVLVVDDNHDAAESMAVLLDILGSEVHVCHDGIEAVEAFSAFQPHAILLDIGLPRLDGYGAAEQIRAQPGGDSVTLIALSGYGRDDDRRRSREAGFDHHLVKPIAPDTLINLLAPIVNNAAAMT